MQYCGECLSIGKFVVFLLTIVWCVKYDFVQNCRYLCDGGWMTILWEVFEYWEVCGLDKV